MLPSENRMQIRHQIVVMKAKIDADLRTPLFTSISWMVGTLITAALIMTAIAVPQSVFVTLMVVLGAAIIGNHRDAVMEAYWRRFENDELQAQMKALANQLEIATSEVAYLKAQIQLGKDSQRYG